MISSSAVYFASILVLAVVSSAAVADEDATHSNTSITETREVELSQTEIDRARAWSLNETEWRRYQRLMQGIRGSVSAANLSPIEVLGIHARDAAERREYAERWAVVMHEDAERILAFQRAYDEAAQRLYPDQRLIDTARLRGDDGLATELQSGDRLLLRVSLACPSCDAAVQKAIDRLDDVAGIDIQFVGANDAQRDRIRGWARAQGIEPEWVRARRVTLNMANAADGRTNDDDSLPGIYIRRGEAIERLAYAAL